MITRRTALALLGSTLLPGVGARRRSSSRAFSRPLIEAGKLPPVDRAPAASRGSSMSRRWAAQPGQYGGVVRTLIGGQRDIRLMTINGYARLVGYDEKLELPARYPGELRRSSEDRIFTFKIRDGHKWSDGTPLTSEDFRYTWEDVLSNEDLSPGGLLAGADRRRQAGRVRGRRRADRPLHLGCAEPGFPAGAGGAAAAQPGAAGRTT